MEFLKKVCESIYICPKHLIKMGYIVLIIMFLYSTSNAAPEGNRNDTLSTNTTTNITLTVPESETKVSNQNKSASDVVTSCKAFITKFSDLAAQFTKCSIINARPLRFCENCVKDYLAAKATYEIIMKGLTEDGPNVPCGRTILRSDKVEIIGQTADFIDKIWKDCNCKNCFNFYDDINSTTTFKVSNETKHFQHLANFTWSCFVNHSRADVIPFPPINFTKNMSVCSQCRLYYEETNTFYIELEEKYSSKVCMDLVDTMNYTRILWSETFKCSRPQEDIVGVLILSGLFCSTPVIFYVTSKIYGSRMEHRILEQKRLRRDEVAKKKTQMKDTVVPSTSYQANCDL